MKSKESKTKGAYESVKCFFANGTIHGLSNFERASQPVFKIVWVIIILVSACYCVFSIITSVNEYFEYDSVMKSFTRYNYPVAIPLPALTICNLDQSLTIDDMLLHCSHGKFKCKSSDFYKMPTDLANIYGHKNCFSWNIGKDYYGNPKVLDLASYEKVRLDIFVGNLKTIENSELGVLVFIHDQKHYPNFVKGFKVPGGNNKFYIQFKNFK